MVNTPDGRTWILDRTGRVYLPCAQSSFPVGYESSQTQIAPPALPYESSTRNLNCVPEYEQEEAFRNTTTNIPIFPSKRCATPLPSRPSHSRADSTPHLAYSGTRAASIKDLSRVPPRFATQVSS
ncbi:unnamed protein product [Echinostoma caproni]|uniref:Uncharacterized protein n=1 Tax=Echinostoma caproni TaxID=27848 RepID=A0A183A1N4_9TREM|nr:unnamed protein product [Echinostoma caproni]